MPEIDNSHYLEHVTELGNEHPVSAHEDIQNTQGIKLIASGTQITPEFYDKLLKHKLLKPIEQSLEIKNCLTADILKTKIEIQINENILLNCMYKNNDDKELIYAIFSSLDIPKILLFKLTIAEKRLPVVFQHSLYVAIATVYFGILLKQDKETLQELAIAGLFHDIGLLHLEHRLFSSSTKLDENERKQIYSHPIIANLILKKFPHFQRISTAVLQHHERMDGSGYPQGLEGDQIAIAGQILIMAELAISLTEQKTNYGYKNRLQAILKFNTQQYPQKVVDVLLNLLNKMKKSQNDENVNITITKEAFLKKLSSIWVSLNAWDYKHDEGLEVPYEISSYVTFRIDELSHALNMSGISLNDMSLSDSDLDEILKDGEEMLALLDEATYQIKNIIYEITRRWPERTIYEDTETAVTKWIISVEELMVESEKEVLED